MFIASNEKCFNSALKGLVPLSDLCGCLTYASVFPAKGKEKGVETTCYLGVVGFFREIWGPINIFIPHLALLKQAIVSFGEYAQITAVFLKIWQVPFQLLAIPYPLYQRPKSWQYVLAWVKLLIPNYVCIYPRSSVGLDPQTVSDGLPINKIQHSIFNNLYATNLYSLSQ